MDSKLLVLVLWISHCLAIVFAVSRQFTGNGYVEYSMGANTQHKAIYSDEDDLKLSFRTVQPSGLLFHSTSSGGDKADYVTLELVGGRLRYAVRYGYRSGNDDAHERFLGKDLDDGKTHTVDVKHTNKVTTITLDANTESDKEEEEINTYYKRVDIDRFILVGGASNFKTLLSVQSNANFMGCLTDVIFKSTKPVESVRTIKFLDGKETQTYPPDMNKDCTFETYAPFTFSAADSHFKCDVNVLATASSLTGSFLFRTYEGSGTLLKQTNGNNGFAITYSARLIKFSLQISGRPELTTQIDYSLSELTYMNSGNWHQVKFSITTSAITLEVGTKTGQRALSSLPSNFFIAEVTSGGYIGCMRNLMINGNECKPGQNSKIKNVEWQGNICNITDFCVFSPCLHGGICTQTGKGFTCSGCDKYGYTGDVCQFSTHHSTCDSLKRDKKYKTDQNYTLDLDGPGPIKPVEVFCNMTADPPVTGIFTKNIGVKLLSASNSPIARDIEYIPSLAAAKALAMNSKTCQQYIKFGCKRARLLENKLSSWVAANGIHKHYWGGATPESEACECWKTKSCLDRSKKCNCDANQDIWTSDSGYLNSTTLLPVTEVVFRGVASGGEANYTVGRLNCIGNVSNTATFVNEDGYIQLNSWKSPSDGVISLYFKTPYGKGTLLYNGVDNKDYFRLQILNETTLRLLYNIGNGGNDIDLKLPENQKLNDLSWHKVVIFRNMKEFGLKLDKLERRNLNPLFLKRDLDVNNHLYVGYYPFDVSKGFVGCIRGLTINGKVQDLCELAADAEYVNCGCGAACEKHACKHGGKCVDNYNVYSCDCSKTPFYGYFCHQDRGGSFNEKDSELIYTYPTVASVPNVDIVVGFKVGNGKPCSGDIIRIDSKDTNQFYLLSLNSENKKLRFSFEGTNGRGFVEIDPPQGQFCDGRHTFALTRRGKILNYTIDEVKKPKFEESKLDGLFSQMEMIKIGRKGDKGFKGCITGVKITRATFGGKPETVEPIKEYFWNGAKGYSASDVSPAGREKCGNEPTVPSQPTPRPIGPQIGFTTGTPNTSKQKQMEEDDKTAIIVVVVLILVLLLVVLAIVIYWYWARHKGEYHTHEDDEELKSVDPYIDLSAPKKPQAEEPEKKKEWYI